jgi:hypothetical protein
MLRTEGCHGCGLHTEDPRVGTDVLAQCCAFLRLCFPLVDGWPPGFVVID